MSIIAGFLCRDGIVIMSDSNATTEIENQITSVHAMRKIEIISDDVLLAVAGTSGVAQQFAVGMRRYLKEHDERLSADEVMCLIADWHLSIVRDQFHLQQKLSEAEKKDFDRTQVTADSLVAMRVGDRAELFHLQGGFIPQRVMKESPFLAIGTGAATASPFIEYLRTGFLGSADLPDVGDAILALLWTLKFVTLVGTKYVGGKPQIAVLLDDKSARARILDGDQLSEHNEALGRVEQRLLEIRRAIRGGVSEIELSCAPDFPE